jgi:tRNA(Ile)-lysidine synthase
MLHVWRSEINDYISKHNLRYREDLTNAEPFAVRNRLRNEAIPLLGEILERDIAPSLLRSLQHAEQNEQFIEDMIDYPGMLDPQGRIHLPSLTEVPQVIQQRILHRYLTEQKIRNISHDLIDSCLSLLDSENPAKINLPRGKFLRRKERRIFVD